MSRENEPLQHTSEMREGGEDRDTKAPGELVTKMWDVRVLMSAENDHYQFGWYLHYDQHDQHGSCDEY